MDWVPAMPLGVKLLLLSLLPLPDGG